MTTTTRVQHTSNGLCSYALRPAQGVLRIRCRSPRSLKPPRFAKLTTLGLSSRANRSDVVRASKSVQNGEVWARRLKAFGSNSNSQLKAATALVFGVAFVLPDAAHAFSIHQEPDNALSFPTWVIHISSVIEWIVAMALVWRYAEVTGNAKWKGLTWGMMPLLGGAICACTYHFFYNSPDLDILVAIQASLTWIGNATCAAAAFRIYQAAQQEGAS